jgi:hypothetical protein
VREQEKRESRKYIIGVTAIIIPEKYAPFPGRENYLFKIKKLIHHNFKYIYIYPTACCIFSGERNFFMRIKIIAVT